LVAAGQSLRLWATGYLLKTDELTTAGPYAYLRHPLYVGSLLMGLWLCAGGGSSGRERGDSPGLVFYFGYYLRYKERVESERLEAIYGDAFRTYRAAVPAIFHASRRGTRRRQTEAPPWRLERVLENDEQTPSSTRSSRSRPSSRSGATGAVGRASTWGRSCHRCLCCLQERPQVDVPESTMSDAPEFEIVAYEPSPIGMICLRRRASSAEPGGVVTEITLDHRFLMSSAVTDSERALAFHALAMHEGRELQVLVGGLVSAYTAREALRSERVARVDVVEFLPPVIDWLTRGLVPLATELQADPRFAVIEATSISDSRVLPRSATT